jgi:hypothetical protein
VFPFYFLAFAVPGAVIAVPGAVMIKPCPVRWVVDANALALKLVGERTA